MMYQRNFLSKEEITQRMIQESFELWGGRDIDRLDPLIRKLIEALACEIYYINNTLEDLEIRLLEKIAETLAPDHLFSVQASHGIMKAQPLINDEIINRYSSFYTSKISQEAMNYSIQNIVFSSVTTVKLVKARINNVISQYGLYNIDLNNNKSIMAKTQYLNESLNKTIYLGLSLDDEIENLHDISFFIDFPLSLKRQEILDLIPYIKWSVNGSDLTMKIGLPDANSVTFEEEVSIKKKNIFCPRDRDITNYYRKQFLTIKDEIEVKVLLKESIPSEITHSFNDRVLRLESQLWIKLEFPAYFTSADISSMEVSLNAFPVINRTLRSESLDTKVNLLKIIPMPVNEGESFLEIESVSDSFGRVYNELPVQQKDVEIGGFYSIKKGGIERFGKRDAKDLIQLVIDKYRDEITAFASIYNDNMQSVFTQLGKMLNAVTERIKVNETNIKEIPVYLLLESLYTDDDDRVKAKYWITNHQIANGIKKGHKFNLYTSSNLDKSSIILLTTTQGGKKEPNSKDKVRGYKYSLMTHDRIITHQDIEAYCLFILGEKVSYIQIKNGVMVSSKPKEGLIRCIDIYIYSADKEYKKVLKDMENDIKVELEIRSSNAYNYRLIIK